MYFYLMRYLVLVLVFCCFGLRADAQSVSNTDTTLKYQRFTKCEKQWVALTRRDKAGRYVFGYVFIDDKAGFVFYAGGLFKVDKDQKYYIDTVAFKKDHPKLLLKPTWQKVAIITPQHFAELGVDAEPDWVKPYYTYKDTALHNERIGSIYNDLNETAIALPYLQKAYHLNTRSKGTCYELAFACNDLGKYDEAIAVLTPAILINSDNAFLYKQLGDAYGNKNDNEKAISSYKLALDHFPNNQPEAKGEAAYVLANLYKKMGNQDEYKNWMTKAKSYTPTESRYYKIITDAGF
jgi:tetratricopeptide (TPR) repeat protein